LIIYKKQKLSVYAELLELLGVKLFVLFLLILHGICSFSAKDGYRVAILAFDFQHIIGGSQTALEQQFTTLRTAVVLQFCG
jgi:hypothetical protein